MSEFQRDRKLEDLKAMLELPGWSVYLDMVQNEVINLVTVLSDFKRPEGQTDDSLRGRIFEAKFLVKGVMDKVKAYDNARILAANPPKEPEAAGSPYVDDEPKANPSGEVE